MFEIFPIRAFSDNYMWTLVKGDQAIVVDPGEAKPIIEAFDKKNLDLKSIIITHHHFDHTGGLVELKDHFNCEVYGPGGGHIEGVSSPLNDNEEFELLGKKFIALHTPAHTLDQLAYYSEEACSDPILFCGDTLFSGGCGRLFEGTPEDMFMSLKRLNNLPQGTKIYCGHEYTEENLKWALSLYPEDASIKKRLEEIIKLREAGITSLPSTLKEERKTNLFIQAQNVKEFSYLRRHKDTWSA